MSDQRAPARPTPERPAPRRPGPDLAVALAYYGVTSAVVLLGIWLGTAFFKARATGGDRFSYHGETYANWDGQWYKSIVRDGYSYSPARRSNVAFFPAYPLLARVCARLTGLGPEQALLVVANLCLAASFVLLHRYARDRSPDGATDVAGYALLAFGLVPTTFFFRAAYSESVFVLATLLVLGAMARGRGPLLVAGLVGLATATRPVGVALVPPLCLYAWDRSRGRGTAARLGMLAAVLPLACWGLADYMFYLQTTFGDPLAFSRTQTYWAVRRAATAGEKLAALATLEPFRALFDPSGPAYWKTYEPDIPRLVSLHFADPFYYLGTAGLVALGAWRGWLDRYEVTLSALLLLIPYWTSSYETYNRSIGRYASVVVPAYVVLGRLLARLPPPLVAALAALAGSLMATYAAMFATWHKYL